MSYPQYSTGMTGHPEMAEMRDRLERTASTGKAIALEGLILLTGVYTAISPWVVHFSGQPNLTANNLIIGITTALIGLGLALVPERMFRLAWALVPLGIWLLISPWIVTPTHGARAGVIWNNILTGVLTMALGLAAMGLTIAVTRSEHR
jgi:DNA-binding transcriptional LysR family regulator